MTDLSYLLSSYLIRPIKIRLCLLPMVLPAKHLTLRQLCFATNCGPRLDSMVKFFLRIDMVDFQVVSRTADYASLASEPGSPTSCHPFSVVCSFSLKVFDRHSDSRLKVGKESRKTLGLHLQCSPEQHPT